VVDWHRGCCFRKQKFDPSHLEYFQVQIPEALFQKFAKTVRVGPRTLLQSFGADGNKRAIPDFFISERNPIIFQGIKPIRCHWNPFFACSKIFERFFRIQTHFQRRKNKVIIFAKGRKSETSPSILKTFPAKNRRRTHEKYS
jgi:hypothetical protein